MEVAPLSLHEGRFSRLQAIEWWDQERLRDARALVVGAGALGNEIIKNLALLGIGQLAVADMDRIEVHNLTRSVLFRTSDLGEAKAEVAVRRALDLYPDIAAQALVGNVLCDVGLGYFRWADVVLGALDNREARLFVNSVCARVGRPWIDGGIDVLRGIIRGFAPPATPCYECTMSRADWAQIHQRQSCSLVARRAQQNKGTPTTPTVASVIGAIQAQEFVKIIHGMDALLGRGFFFEGTTFDCYTTTYPLLEDCPWHEPAPEILAMEQLSSQSTIGEIRKIAADVTGGPAVIDFSREIVAGLDCPACGDAEPVFRGVDAIAAWEVMCPRCQVERIPRLIHSVQGPEFDRYTIRQIGLPAWDILWLRRGEHIIGLELAGDNPWKRPITSEIEEGEEEHGLEEALETAPEGTRG